MHYIMIGFIILALIGFKGVIDGHQSKQAETTNQSSSLAIIIAVLLGIALILCIAYMCDALMYIYVFVMFILPVILLVFIIRRKNKLKEWQKQQDIERQIAQMVEQKIKDAKAEQRKLAEEKQKEREQREQGQRRFNEKWRKKESIRKQEEQLNRMVRNLAWRDIKEDGQDREQLRKVRDIEEWRKEQEWRKQEIERLLNLPAQKSTSSTSYEIPESNRQLLKAEFHRIRETEKQEKDIRKQRAEVARQHMIEFNKSMDEKKIERDKMTPGLRYNILRRDGFRCRLCGRTAEDGVTLEVDHIVPISKGGLTEESNLRTLCKDCNRGKGAKIE